MVSSSTMHNFPSPWRVNHAGEVVRDVDATEQVLHKVSSPSSPSSPERTSIFSSDSSDAQKTNNKNGKKESWFRIVRKKKDKQEGDNALDFQRLDNILENMECFSCGTMGDTTEDGKKKKKFLPTLTVSKKGGKADDEKNKKENKIKRKEQAAASKDKGSASPEQNKTKWFQKKKQHDEQESDQYDIWAAVMPSSFTGLEFNSEKDDKKEKAATSKDNGSAKTEQKTKWFQKKKQQDAQDEPESAQYDIWAAVMPASFTSPESKGDVDKDKKKPEKKTKLQWFRLSRKGKEEKKKVKEESQEQEASNGFDFNELSAMITALVNGEAEQVEEKSPSEEDKTKKDQTKQDDTNGTDTEESKDVDPNTESSLALWYERLKSEGEGYIRFVSGSDPSEAEDAPNYSLPNGTSPKGEGEGEEVSMDGTVVSDGSSTWATEYSSYEVPSLRQEMKMLMTGRFGSSPKKARWPSKASHPQEDEKFLLRKIANDPESRTLVETSKGNTLTLQTLNKVGKTTREHGFKVKLHEDRALCEV